MRAGGRADPGPGYVRAGVLVQVTKLLMRHTPPTVQSHCRFAATAVYKMFAASSNSRPERSSESVSAAHDLDLIKT